MVQASYLYYFRPDTGWPTGELLQRAAKYETGYLTPDQFVLPDPYGYTGVPDYTEYAAFGDRVRAINPRHKVGIYMRGLGYTCAIEGLYAAIGSAEMLHMPSPDLRPLNGYIGGLMHAMLNLTSRTVRQKIVDYYRTMMHQNRFDALMIDAYNSPWFYADWVTRIYQASNGCLEGPAHTTEFWMEPLARMGEELRWGLAQDGRTVVGVGIAPVPNPTGSHVVEAWSGVGFTNISEMASGAIFEMMHDAYGEEAKFADMLAMVKQMVDKRRSVMMAATPWFDARQNPLDPILQRWYEATYRLMEEPPYTSLMFHPYEPYRGYTTPEPAQPYVYWNAEWEQDIGLPLGPWYKQEEVPIFGAWPHAVWARLFTGGKVIVNPTREWQCYQDPSPRKYRVWDKANGGELDMTLGGPYYLMNIPPLNGWILYNA